MPTYEYRCPKCEARFERFQKITAPPLARCPKCRARAQRLLSGGAGLIFKGSGFYVTDYQRAGEKKKKEAAETADAGREAESSKSSGPGAEKPAPDD